MDEKTNFAVDVVARQVIASALLPGSEAIGEIGWADYPDLGEHDWGRVAKRVDRIREAMQPSDHVYESAYEHLVGRAEK